MKDLSGTKTALIYSDRLGSYTYGHDHPMRPFRLRLAFELIEALGLTRLASSKVIEARAASAKELESFHTPDYLNILKEANSGGVPANGPSHGIGAGDNPAFPGVYDWSALCAGASIQAASMVASGEARTAFNISGGLHHAMADRASGFCYINDAAVAVKLLADNGKRVAYVDIDAHHGDGVEEAFCTTNRVITISLHESGESLFPGTGFASDIGKGVGKGYSVNLPLPPGIDDDGYMKAFDEVIPPFIRAFRPDVLVTQLGVDAFSSDPLTHLDLTTRAFEHALNTFRSFDIPWVGLGGGGYNMSNVARGWAIAWGIMNGVILPKVMPESFLLRYGDLFETTMLRDDDRPQPKKAYYKRERLEKDIAYLNGQVLPLVKDN